MNAAYSIPSQTSDAGPSPRSVDREALTLYQCACGVRVTRHDGVRCQGSDTCTARICESCRTACALCGLPVCPQHRTDFGGELTCEICLAATIEEGLALSAEAAR